MPNLTPGDLKVLDYIKKHPRCTNKEIKEALNLWSGQITHFLNGAWLIENYKNSLPKKWKIKK